MVHVFVRCCTSWLFDTGLILSLPVISTMTILLQEKERGRS